MTTIRPNADELLHDPKPPKKLNGHYVHDCVVSLTGGPVGKSPEPHRAGTEGLPFVGLEDAGSSCYMNSSLQCLANIPEVATHYSQVRESNATELQGFDLSHVFGHVLYQLRHEKKSFEPVEFQRCCAGFEVVVGGKTTSKWPRNTQQDFMDFFEWLIDNIRDHERTALTTTANPSTAPVSLTATSQVNPFYLTSALRALEAWNAPKTCLDTTITSIFRFQDATFSPCSTQSCNNYWPSFATRRTLAIDVSTLPAMSPLDLPELLAREFQETSLDQYHCSGCSNVSIGVSHRRVICRLPLYLVIQLQRSGTVLQDDGKQAMRVCRNLITFPESLDVQRYLAPWLPPPTPYHLEAVTSHYGGNSPTYGHYKSFVKRMGQWIECDNSRLRPVSFPVEVMTSNAYVLFYRAQRLSAGS